MYGADYSACTFVSTWKTDAVYHQGKPSLSREDSQIITGKATSVIYEDNLRQ